MRPWIYTTNPIDKACDRSFINALQMSNYHDSALASVKTDTFFTGLYGTYHPIHVAFKNAYDNWKTQGGNQQGETLNLKQLLQLLSHNKIQTWDIKIQNIYPQSTPQYKRLLPNHRAPFQNGLQTERIHAVQSLSKAIGADTALAAVKADIDNFYTQLDTVHVNQKSTLVTTKSQSSALDTARVAMCNAQYANLGALIQRFAASPEKIEQYFDQKALRHATQVLFTGNLKANIIHTIVKHTFSETDEIYLSNTGVAPLEFYLAENKSEKPGTSIYKLAPATSQTIPETTLGKLTNTYVTVYNPDANLVGEYEIEIL